MGNSCSKLSQLNRNPVVLYMSLLVHMAPRVLRIGDLWERMDIHRAIPPSKGVALRIPGPELCMYNLLQDLHSRFPVQIGQQVDDINHHSQGTFFQTLHWSVEATCMLDRGLTSLGLTISHNKSMVVASHPQLLRAVRRELLEQGIIFRRSRLLCVM